MRLAMAFVILLLLVGAAVVETAAAAPDPPFSSSDYEIEIFYYLINRRFDNQTVSFTIPIPPNTTWQTTHLLSYSFFALTRPYHDQVNNTLMDFSIPVPPLNVTTFRYKVSVQVNSTPGYPVNPTFAQIGNRNDIPSSLSALTQPTHWWNYTDSELVFPVTSLGQYRSEPNLTRVAKAVRDEIVGSRPGDLPLIGSYRANRIRLGATQALQLGLGDSSEFSDVFVALMRSTRVPATRLWSWLISDVQAGVVTFRGFIQSAFWSPGLGWLPYDVTTSKYADRPAIGEVSDRVVTFYIENDLPGPEESLPIMLNQDETFFPGGGSAVKSGVLATTRILVNYIPRSISAAVQLFTLTTTVGVAGAAIILVLIISGVGYQRARARRRRIQERLDQFEKRLKGVTRG